jgi:hypothetical protein
MLFQIIIKMKTKIYNSGIILGFLLLINQGIYSQNEVKKEFHEEFPTNQNTVLTLDNKYGDMDLKNWDKDLIQIDVIVNVKNTSQEKAEKLLGYVDVVFSVEGDAITAKTVFDEKFSNTSEWRNDNDLSIDYTVLMPKDIQLNLYNKYGDVFINELTGRATIGIKYGKLKANRISRGNEKPLTEIDLGYSDASIEESDWLKVTMKYSNLNMNTASAIILLSKYSKISLSECSSLVIEGKYDVYRLGKLSNLVASCSYSNFEVEEIRDKLSMDTEYGDCKVDYVPATFSSIDITTKYGGYRIGIDPNASYQIDGQAEYAKISYPDVGKVSRIAENTSMQVNGIVGKDSNTAATVRIVTKYGGIKLDE